MACKNCRDFTDNSCTDITTTNCVKSMADPVEELDICLNDSLTYVLNIVLGKVKDFMVGKGIEFNEEDLNFDDCDFLNDILDGETMDLINVLNTYKEAICTLKATTEATDATILAFTNTALYTLGCLPAEDPCGDPYTFKELIQAIITKLCEINTTLESFTEGLLDAVEEITGNFLVGGAITSCGGNGISFSGSGASAVVTFEALVPPNCPIIYTGSTAGLFDMDGIGLPGTIMCGWYLCNGDNGTPDSADLPQNTAEDIVYIIRFT